MTPDEYLAEVRLTIDSFRDTLSKAELDEIEELVIHGEPAEGLRTLAWILHENGHNIDLHFVNKVLSLIDGLVPNIDMPPRFRKKITNGTTY